jgi:PAS domain S-box-containing protein
VAEPFVQMGLLGEAVDGADAAVLVADDRGAYVAVNRFACEMLGYERKELVQLNVKDVVVADDVEAHYAQFVRDRFDEGTATLQRKDGSTFSFRYRASETAIGALTYYVSVGWPE